MGIKYLGYGVITAKEKVVGIWFVTISSLTHDNVCNSKGLLDIQFK